MEELEEIGIKLKPPYCLACRSVGILHCSDFIHCGEAVFPEDEKESSESD